MLTGRAISIVIDSIVVPRVGNLRLATGIGSSVRCSRVPIVLLATGAALRTGIRNFRYNTSMCVRGPFSVHRLHGRVRGLLGLHRTFRGVVTRLSNNGKTSPVDPMRCSISRGSYRLVTGIQTTIRTRLSSRGFSISALTRSLGVDHSGFCHGVGTLTNVPPGSCLGAVHLGGTTRLLGDKIHVARIYRGVNFDSSSCFTGYFGVRFKMLPGSCR